MIHSLMYIQWSINNDEYISEYSVKCIDEHDGALIPFACYVMMIYTQYGYDDEVAYNEMMIHFNDLFTVYVKSAIVCTV